MPEAHAGASKDLLKKAEERRGGLEQRMALPLVARLGRVGGSLCGFCLELHLPLLPGHCKEEEEEETDLGS